MTSLNMQEIIEYFQLLFLLFISRKIDRRYYILKGGCNIRFFFKSPRYSEDIDFDLQDIPVQKFQEQINKILLSPVFKEALSVKGLAITHITESKQTETTKRWKLHISSNKIHNLPTRIEFSRRGGKRGESRFEAVDSMLIRRYGLPPVLVHHYTAETSFLQKIEAISSRRVPQARDIFDLYLLITTGVNISNLLENMEKSAISKAKSNIFSINYDTFKSQVVSYLSPDDRKVYGSEEVWDAIRLKVIEVVEGGDKK